MSLEGTPFIFSEDIEETDGDDMSVFFCQVDNNDTLMAESTENTGFTVSNDLTSFHLTAANTNSEALSDLSTREVADCENLGPDETEFEEGAWPLQYVGE